jgi:hypothetical protein
VSNEAQPIHSHFARLKIEKSIARAHAIEAQSTCSLLKLPAARNTNGASQMLSEKHILQGKRRRT